MAMAHFFSRNFSRYVRRLSLGALWSIAAVSATAEERTWLLAGSLGNVQFIVIPSAQARDTAFYTKVIAEVCAGAPSCFVRFYTNTLNAPITFPLPDAISNEPAAMYSLSAKQGRVEMRYACRIGLPEGDCF